MMEVSGRDGYRVFGSVGLLALDSNGGIAHREVG